jgi:hypothetical protein
MKSFAVLIGILLALAAPADHAAATEHSSLEVSFDRTRIDSTVGRVLTVESTVTNNGDTASGPFVAHLNVTSLDSGVYVDLEDWSENVTKELPALRPNATTSVSWTFHAVNTGDFTVYVVLLPERGPLIASPPVRVQVAGTRSLDAGGALPVLIVVPALLGLLTAAIRYRSRR